MPRISDFGRGRIHLLGLEALSIVPVILQRSLFQARIYDVWRARGSHPSDLLDLRIIGGLVIYIPFIILVALFLSLFRPAVIRRLVPLCVTILLLFLPLFLYEVVVVILLNVPPSHT